MSLIHSLRMIAEGSMFEVAQLAVQPEDKSCPAHLQMHSSWQSRRVGDTRKIEGESVGRFVDRGQTHSWIHHTPEAQDPAACGTALAAMPAPAGGSCFRHARHNLIPSICHADFNHVISIHFEHLLAKKDFMLEMSFSILLPYRFPYEKPRDRKTDPPSRCRCSWELNVGKQK